MAAVLAIPPSASAETSLLTPAEIRSWLKSAQPRDVLVYCSGPRVPDGPAKQQVAALIKEGAVGHEQRRVGGQLQHRLVRKAKRAASGRRESGRGDVAQTAILLAILAAARRGARCPSDGELARTARLATRNQAAWRLRKLKEAGLVRTWTVRGPDNSAWRMAEVNGKTTAAPPEFGA